jgi:uncharacterized protein YbaA (DUF1428 family)
MYVQGFLVPVPEGTKQAYHDMAAKFWEIAQEYGATEHMEAWEADVPDGNVTDFRRSVRITEGEKVVFSWVTWPDKASADKCMEALMSDPRMENMGEMPFDGQRMIYGGFEPLLHRKSGQ